MKVIKRLLVAMLMGIMVAGQIELCGMGTKKRVRMEAASAAASESEGEDSRPMQRSRLGEEAGGAEMLTGSTLPSLVTGVVEADSEFSDDVDGERLYDVEEMEEVGAATQQARKVFACEYPGCGKKFTQQCSLARHKKSVHEGIRFVCDVDGCGKGFTQRGHFSQHKKSVHEGIGCQCDVAGCGKSFANKSHHAQHKRTVHEGVRYHCDVDGCGKAFTRQGHLSEHKKAVHEGVRYSCDTCGQEFSHKSHLSEHKKAVHEGIRYLCDTCGKEFAWKIQLAQHKKTAHEGVRYHCDVDGCGKEFTWPSDLARHKKTVHEGVRYHCDVDGCGKSFTNKSHLTQHKRSVHGGIVGGRAKRSWAAQAGVSRGLRVLAQLAARKILTIGTMATFDEIVGQLHEDIETLQMQDNQQVTDEVLICVAGCCVALKHFDVRGCVGITIDGLKAILAACEGLETLHVSVNDSLTAEVIDELKAAWPSLEILCAAQV